MLNSINKTVVLFIAIFILALFLLQKNCSGKNTTQKIVIPEKVGTFDKADTVIVTKLKDSLIWKQVTIKTENPINKKMAAELVEALKYKDSVKVLKMYLEAIQERDGTYVFDNKDMKLEVATRTRGEILSIKPTYKIKEREETIPVKNKETVFALYGGVGVSNTLEFNNPSLQAEIGFQNKSGDILSAGYDTQKNISIKYSKQLFKIKR